MPPMRRRGNADIGLAPLFVGPIPPLEKIRFFWPPDNNYYSNKSSQTNQRVQKPPLGQILGPTKGPGSNEYGKDD